MGFKENLRSQLDYSGLLIKELAALSGLKKKTIDSYMRKDGPTPSVEAAISIAKALNVSVEYLVTGNDPVKEMPLASLPKDIQEITFESIKLNAKDRNVILSLARLLNNR
ncbi:MAG: helix-turn-helix domain-containing protein [Treponema sp.]|nr:helix-turn-helix domain-containing protein [Treponema sp.]MCL2252427.1 helix-turn-helix domain-containing protein [Treponema sp.]